MSLFVRCVSYQQQIVGPCFLIQSIWLSVGELNQLTFTVMIEKYLLILCFYYFFFPGWVSCYSLLLALFIFRFCWLRELIMLDTFLALMGSSILPHSDHAWYFPRSHGFINSSPPPFFFAQLGFELRAYNLIHTTSPVWWWVFSQ
jgi:hypothetical protein